MLKRKLSKKEIITLIKNTSLIVIGSILLAFGTGIFLVPSGINAGGLSGIALIFQATLNWEVDIVVGVLVWSLFALSIFFLGRRFAMQTLVATIVYPIALSLLLRIPYFIDLSSALLGAESGTAELLIAGLFGGAFVGAGCAVTFLGGGSTGGVDILAFMIHKYLRVKHSISSFFIDAIIVFIGMLTIGNLVASLVGVVSALISALMIEYIFIGKSTAFVATIISTKWEEINQFIQEKMERGTTIINVEGGFKFNEYRMISVVFDRKEYGYLYAAIAQIDPKAFVTFVQAQSVHGEGFNHFVQKKRFK